MISNQELVLRAIMERFYEEEQLIDHTDVEEFTGLRQSIHIQLAFTYQ